MPSPPTYHNHSHFNKTIQKFIFTVKILINAQALINTHLPQFQLKKCRILGPFPKKLVPLLNAHYKKMRGEKKKKWVSYFKQSVCISDFLSKNECALFSFSV